MRVTLDYLIGRRFHWRGYPDVTFVSWKPDSGPGKHPLVSTHSLSGSQAWLPLRDVQKLITTGVIEEAEWGEPFTVFEGQVY